MSAQPPPVPDAVVADRAPVLRRALRGLPDPMLVALVDGLEKHGDHLVSGRLFTWRGDGGCAVGVMLLELAPEDYEPGTLRFWARHGWRRSVRRYGRLGKRSPRLRHLEWAFDWAVRLMRESRPDLSRRQVLEAVGLWFRTEAQAELDARRLFAATGAGGPPVEPKPARSVARDEAGALA